MPRLNLEEQALAIILCELNENNTAKIARILSKRIRQYVDPSVVRRILRKNNIEIHKQGCPKKIDDTELERCFRKHSSQDVSVTRAAQKTAEELGYAIYTSVLYRWRKMYLY